MRYIKPVISLLFLLMSASAIIAQDLDPRAYVQVPLKTTSLTTGFVLSHGGVVTDPTLPVTNIKANVESASFAIARSLNFFGLTSTALVALPYSWAQVSGDVGDQQQSITRSGYSDMRLRFSVLFHGAPAATLAEMRKSTTAKKTILGASINIVAPTGQFMTGKLINLGANRWAFRPELALSQPLGKKWMVDVYSGIWFFTNNNSFYPGTYTRTQDPMGAFQTHISYNFKPVMWIAFDATYYVGGQTTIENSVKDDRQSNARIGLTGVFPTGKTSSLKFAVSTGAVVRIGQDFTTYSIGWQKSWIDGLSKNKPKNSN